MLIPLTADGRGWILARLGCIGAVQAMVLVAFALSVQRIFDEFVAPGITGPIWNWGSLLLSLALLAALLRYLERTDAERLGQRYVHALRSQMLETLGRVPARSLARFSRGGVLLKFVGDLSAIRQWVTLAVARLSVALLTGVGTLAALTLVSWRLAMVVGIAIVIPGILVAWSGRPLERSVRLARRRRGRLSGDVSERIGSLAVIQVHGQVDRERRRVLRRSAALADAMLQRAHWVGIIRALTEVSLRAGVAAALLIGVIEVAAGRLSPGGVVAAMAIVGFLTSPLRELGRAYEYWQSAKVARERIVAFLALPNAVADVPDAPKLRRVHGVLRFEQVCVDDVLQRISAQVPRGSRVLMSGPNGSGKSTLLWCAARLIDPTAGRVLLDGQDLANVRLSSVRRHIGFASPDLPLMRGTVQRNLVYRKPRATGRWLQQTIDDCGLRPMLDELPNGLDTRLVDEGRNLSIGQRQLLILARAMYGQPELLLLDEPDTGLDKTARELLSEAIDRYPGTVLIASHHPSWRPRVDQLWHLEGGRLETEYSTVVSLERPA